MRLVVVLIKNDIMFYYNDAFRLICCLEDSNGRIDHCWAFFRLGCIVLHFSVKADYYG